MWKGKRLKVDKNEESGEFEPIVFVSNVPFVVDNDELRLHFAKCGVIEDLRVIREYATLIGKGIAYVKYANKEQMK